MQFNQPNDLQYHCLCCGNRCITDASKIEQRYVHVSRIWLLEADGSYTILHCADGHSHVVSKNLHTHAEWLPQCFAQPNQSHIINPHYLRGSSTGSVLITDFAIDERIVVKNNYKEDFERQHNQVYSINCVSCHFFKASTTNHGFQ